MVKWRVYVCVCLFPKHSRETTVFSRVSFSGWSQLLVNIWGACVPSRSCPLSSSFGIWRDLLDCWHFHPIFLLAPLYLFLLFPIAFPSLHPSPPFLFYKGLKSLIVASPNQTALLNVPEPVSIQPEESFHLPLYTPKLGILAMEINSHLSSILKRDFFNSEPKDAENHTLIQIRIAESRHGISTERDLAFIR